MTGVQVEAEQQQTRQHEPARRQQPARCPKRQGHQAREEQAH